MKNKIEQIIVKYERLLNLAINENKKLDEAFDYEEVLKQETMIAMYQLIIKELKEVINGNTDNN